MKPIRVLLVLANVRTGFVRLFPFGLGAISAWAKARGLPVEVQAVSLDHRWQHRRFGRLLARHQPDLVGITGPSCQAALLHRLVGQVRAFRRDLPVILGGHHAMLVPDRALAETGVDLVVSGEGELPFAEVIERLARGERALDGIPGSVTLAGSQAPLPFHPELDALPVVDRSILDFQAVTDANMGNVFLLAGRGCGWRCTFCSNHVFAQRGTGRWMRMRSVEHVLDEIAQLEQRYRFRGFVFRDDTFTWDRSWALDFCAQYARRFRYPFCIFTRADCVDGELAGALARAGCTAAWLGVDSGNPRIRDEVLKKTCSDEQIVAACDTLHRAGVAVLATNMVGLPFETAREHADTVDLNRRIYRGARSFNARGGVGPKCFVFGPFPGTDLYDLCEENGWIRRTEAAVYRESPLDLPGFPAAEVERAARRFRWEVHKADHPGLALTYRFRDSRAGEALFRMMPGGLMARLAAGLERVSDRGATRG